ncbi:diguanylate cyclase [Ferrimonas pelagia]|uniref:Diguanylate cyclase n=1 Tax=Ferrimonas pelagia TaxID=1177826 RepID=A0ABP9F266_9GAMM
MRAGVWIWQPLLGGIALAGALGLLWGPYPKLWLSIYLSVLLLLFINFRLRARSWWDRGSSTYWWQMMQGWHEPALVYSEQGTVLALSPALSREITGIDAQHCGRPLELLFPEAMRADQRKLRDTFFGSDGHSGQRLWFRLLDKQGRWHEYLGQQRLLTRRKERVALITLAKQKPERALESNLPQLRQRMSDTFEFCAIGLAHMSLSGVLVRANRQMQALLGFKEDELLGHSLHSFTFEPDVDSDLRDLQYLLCGQRQSYCAERRYRRKDGQLIWGRVTVSLVSGEPDYFLIALQDIEIEKAAQQQLLRSEHKFRVMAESWSEHAVAWIGSPWDNTLLYVNQGIERLWQLGRAQVYEQPTLFIERVHPDDRARVSKSWQEQGNRGWDLSYRIQLPNGEVRHVRDRGQAIRDDKGQLCYVVAMALDVTVEVALRQELEDSVKELHHAYSELALTAQTDALTGVLNRRAIVLELQREGLRCQRHQQRSSLVFLDLNDFKPVNDELGHGVGDQVLSGIAAHLRAQLREVDLLGRYGGDEFLILLVNTSVEDAEQFCRRVISPGIVLPIEALAQRPIQLSWGICEINAKITSVEEVMRMADKHMYRQKEDSKRLRQSG